METGMSRIFSGNTPDGRRAEILCYDTEEWGRTYAIGQGGDYCYHTSNKEHAKIAYGKIASLTAEQYRRFNPFGMLR